MSLESRLAARAANPAANRPSVEPLPGPCRDCYSTRGARQALAEQLGTVVAYLRREEAAAKARGRRERAAGLHDAAEHFAAVCRGTEMI